MRIGIVTLYGEFNYGNRLQNYALQIVLEKLGNEVTSIVAVKDHNIIKRYLKLFLVKQGKSIHFRSNKERKRERNFISFTKKYIKTDYYKNSTKIPHNASGAECYVVGSDQVWNPLYWENKEDSNELYNFCLGFTDKKKIAYAASFGISKLPEEWENRFRPFIRAFDFISVRENEAINIIKKMGRQATVVLDPTLLLTEKDWRVIESNIINNEKQYALFYFLGEKPEYIQVENGLDIIDLMDVKSKWYTCGPGTFVELIDKAKIVYTDSFHATVFSLIFKTPFVVYNRKHSNKSDMSGRIITLLEIAGIENGMSSSSELMVNKIREDGQKRIDEKRKVSKQMLSSALK